MPRTHDLTSPAFAALIDAWANRWVLGQELSEAIAVEAATAALNDAEMERAKRDERDPEPLKFAKLGTMRDRFGHLIRIGKVSTRDRGDTRQTALSMNLGTPGNEGSATLRDGLAAYLADPAIGTSAKDNVVSALRFIMRRDLGSGHDALLQEAERYGADQLALLLSPKWIASGRSANVPRNLADQARAADRSRSSHAPTESHR